MASRLTIKGQLISDRLFIFLHCLKPLLNRPCIQLAGTSLAMGLLVFSTRILGRAREIGRHSITARTCNSKTQLVSTFFMK